MSPLALRSAFASPARLCRGLAFAAGLLWLPATVSAQRMVRQPEQVVSVSKGASVLIVNQTPLQRFSVGDPAVAEAVVVSPTEILVNGKTLGTTSLVLWDNTGTPRLYSIEVTADAPGLERYLSALMPEENISVSASGNSVTLSGNVKDPNSVARAIEVARSTGAVIVDNMVAPPAVQVLLQVRFAEISRTAAKDFDAAFNARNTDELRGNLSWEGNTVSEGLIRALVSSPGANIEAIIAASKSRGQFRSLAEPNLLTIPGKEAYFLAGGEFPFPTIQAGNQSGGITIVFKDFGIKLRFTPTITRSGAIRLKLAPEVSSLDFANGLVIQGFTIPTVLTRRAETEVELREGQHLAIAGLMDNNTVKNVTKIPILGDIPILGQFFRSTDAQQRRTELLVLVSPRLVQGTDTATPLPTEEPKDWEWDGSIGAPKTGPPAQH
ncbi:MAG: type II and III secretion system protein family protein [Chloroflexi bacterium]|nr:type II and III secretion system protein family protein [Chloroflexota bacterium]